MIQENYTTFAEQLQGIRNSRKGRGQSYEWQYLLLIVACAVMAGERSVRGMAQWAAEQAPDLIASLQRHRQRIPSVATLHRVLTDVPIAVLESRMSAYTSHIDQDDAAEGSIQTKQGETPSGQSVDGKTLRGASQHGEDIHLVSLVRHESAVLRWRRSVSKAKLMSVKRLVICSILSICPTR